MKEVKETILNPIEKDEEIKKLKKQIAGYKGQVRTLQKRVVDWDDAIAKKNETIDNLRCRVFELEKTVKEVENKHLDAMEYIATLEDTIERYEHPWWRKMFG